MTPNSSPSNWLLFKLIVCRIAMIIYSIWLIIECAMLFDNKLVYLNCAFSILIIIDGTLVIKTHGGLEDRWCSLSVLFFVCGTSIPFWLLEITSSVILTKSVFSSDRAAQLEIQSRELAALNPLRVGTNESLSRDWLENVSDSQYMSMLGKHEAFFSSVLIISRIFIPQAKLTWSDISNQSEFAFNTIFDIYSTLSLIRDSRIKLSRSIWIMTFVVCNSALYPIALNAFPQDNNNSNKDQIENDHFNNNHELVSNTSPQTSFYKFRRITDSPYFRLGMQVALADFPFLVLRLIILTNLRFVRREMYYLIAKQIIIIVCKLGIMAYDWCRVFLYRLAIEEIKRINRSNAIKLKFE